MTALKQARTDEAPLVHLVFAESPVERSLIDRWLQDGQANGTRVDAGERGVADALAAAGGGPSSTC